MKDLLILEYIADRAELMSKVAVPKIDERHEEAFTRLRDHLRELYRVYKKDFGAVTLERIQNFCEIYEGRTPPPRFISRFETMETAEKILALKFHTGTDLKDTVA